MHNFVSLLKRNKEKKIAFSLIFDLINCRVAKSGEKPAVEHSYVVKKLFLN